MQSNKWQFSNGAKPHLGLGCNINISPKSLASSWHPSKLTFFAMYFNWYSTIGMSSLDWIQHGSIGCICILCSISTCTLPFKNNVSIPQTANIWHLIIIQTNPAEFPGWNPKYLGPWANYLIIIVQFILWETCHDSDPYLIMVFINIGMSIISAIIPEWQDIYIHVIENARVHHHWYHLNDECMFNIYSFDECISLLYIYHLYISFWRPLKLKA